jgi:hypothetical protein
MIKHVNFTGRRRIPRTCIDVVVHEGSPRTFDATLNLKTTRMPPEAKVYLEAMCAGSSVVQRFSFGTVASPKTPSRRQLDEIDGERVFFALKVVDEAQWVGRILGLAEHIQPRQADRSPETGRRGILPIVPKSLGQELWKIEFEEHEVILCVSENVPNIKERIRRDALLQAAIYPAAVRIVVAETLAQSDGNDDETDRWPCRWVQFARGLHPDGLRPPDQEIDRTEWIDDVVAAFAAKHSLADHLVASMRKSDGDDVA